MGSGDGEGGVFTWREKNCRKVEFEWQPHPPLCFTALIKFRAQSPCFKEKSLKVLREEALSELYFWK
jgi:hypothetical protein